MPILSSKVLRTKSILCTLDKNNNNKEILIFSLTIKGFCYFYYILKDFKKLKAHVNLHEPSSIFGY